MQHFKGVTNMQVRLEKAKLRLRGKNEAVAEADVGLQEVEKTDLRSSRF